MRRLALAALGLFALIGLFSYSQRSGDFAGYLLVGGLVVDGGHIYADLPAGINTWPPLFSLMCAPLAVLSRLSPVLARGLWVLINYAAVLLLLDVLARLVHGKKLSLRARPGDAGRSDGTGATPPEPAISLADAAIFVPLLLSSRWLLSNLEHLQVNVLIFAMALAGLYLIAVKREGLGALALGLGAALKVMPIVFVPYLAYRRRWRAAILTALAAAAFSLVPVLVFGWARFSQYVIAWREQVAAGWGVSAMNHCVFAMIDRLIGHRIMPFTSADIVPLPESGSPWVTATFALALVAVGAWAWWASRGAVQQGSQAAIAEWSVVFIVAVLFGPVARLYYFVILLLPNVLLYAVWRAPDAGRMVRRIAAVSLFVPFVLATIASPELVGDHISELLEMSSVLTVAILVALAGLLWLRPHLPTEPSESGGV